MQALELTAGCLPSFAYGQHGPYDTCMVDG